MTSPKIGVIGGGQLARMMAPVALNLGIDLSILCEASDVSSARAVATAPIGDYKDREAVLAFARTVDVVTFDHEHVPQDLLQAMEAEGIAVRPGSSALRHAQDKLVMRKAAERLGLPNPRWAEAATVDDVLAFGDEIGWPIVAKTPRGGYDGKGVRIVERAEAGTVAEWMSHSTVLLEEKVDFSRELSVLVARRPSGEVRAWPMAHTIQVDGVCDEVIAPAQDLAPEVQAAAVETATSLAAELGVTGVLAVELFEVPGREPGFIINELAMRPHNTGHWTQDGAVTSQFEQHLRAVLDWPLGDTKPLSGPTIMKNYLGGANQDLHGAFPAALAADPEAKVHMYGKSVRPGRKIGHVNLVGAPGADVASLRERAGRVAGLLRDGA
ncbi:MAG: 5-(carboxyamino)imidazole ribonucleotide synthase [Arthrobacter sp.]|nr:5-(carboxyamino)imidazole ribonucleotide synthase [Arthrobacter sp.]